MSHRPARLHCVWATRNLAAYPCEGGMMTEDDPAAAARSNVPIWYWVAAIGALLFECLGCFFYIEEVRLTPEQVALLPLDQAAMLAARPAWYYAAFAIAVWVGLLGTIGLLLRKGWAVTLLLVSFLAVVVQFSAIFIVPEMRVVSSDALLGPIIIIVVSYGIYQFGRLAKHRGWLR